MQSTSSRIWTCVAISISYDDNHYTTSTSKQDNHIPPIYMFDAVLNSARWRPPATKSHFSPLWTYCAAQKYKWVTWYPLNRFAEAFQVFVTEFSPKISGLFINRSSSFPSAQSWMTWKKIWCKQKYVEKNRIAAENLDYSYILPRYHVRW